MRLGFFVFLISLPFFAALAFDVLDYQLNPAEGFRFNILGQIWAQNFTESYIATRDSMAPETWQGFVAILKEPAVKIAFLFAHLVFVLTALLKLIGWFTAWTRSVSDKQPESQDAKDLEFLRKNKKTDFKYKKKR